MKTLHTVFSRVFSGALLLSALYLGVSAAHACTPPRSYFKNVSCTPTAGVFLAAKDDGSPVALLDRRGKETAKLFDYQAALGLQYREGLLPVLKAGKVGYINSRGRVVIRAQYDRMPTGNWARGARDGRIIVRRNGAFGVLDTTGKVVLNFDRSIQNITDFNNGIATVTKARETFQIDTNGRRINISPADTTTAPPQQVSSPVIPASTTTSISRSSIIATSPSSPALTATEPSIMDGRVAPTQIIPLMQNSTAPASTSIGRANNISQAANTPRFFPHNKDGKWGFIDSQGVVMILYVFDEVREYSEGLAAVRQGSRWGFIDYAGDLMIDFRFENSGIIASSNTPATPAKPLLFINGKAWIGNLANNTKMCINNKGEPTACE